MPLFLLFATILSTAVSAYGSYAQGQAQKKMAQYNADVAEQQAKITQRNAETNVSLVQTEAANQTKLERRNLAILEGEQKGILASQGIGGSVTAADIEKSTLTTAELDRQAIRYNAESKSYAIKTGADFESWNLENESNQYKMAGKNAEFAGNLGVGTSLLSGATSIASANMTNNYYKAMLAKKG